MLLLPISTWWEVSVRSPNLKRNVTLEPVYILLVATSFLHLRHATSPLRMDSPSHFISHFFPTRLKLPVRIIIMIRTTILVAILTLTGICQNTEAFAPVRFPSSSLGLKSIRQTTAINGNTKFAPSLPPIKDISYGEESRKYRRTVYSHDDWRKHRNPDRFLYYIVSLLSSGVYKNVGREVAFTTIIAAFVCLWNGLVNGFTDLDGVKHAAILTSNLLPLLSLPLAPFTLSSPSLGLLLGK
jgi:hypothetical protein